MHSKHKFEAKKPRFEAVNAPPKATTFFFEGSHNGESKGNSLELVIIESNGGRLSVSWLNFGDQLG